MNPFNVLRSFLVSLTITAYIVISIESPSRLSTCHPDQRDALSRFNRSFLISGPTPSYLIDSCMGTSYPKTTSWREDEDCCSWEGVTCDNSTGDIVGLDLSCARLRGAIDSNSSLFSLRHLRHISLAQNDLIGSSIPPEISVFPQMTYLNLSSSNISGNVPPEISQLSKLVSLDLSGNGLEVQNPTMRMLVKNLTRLEDLDLIYVHMSTVIPTSLMNFSSSLISLHLSGCSLGGKFLDYIFQLPNLQQLDLSWNYGLYGTLPESNWSSSLAFLSLRHCYFNGGVPNSISTLTRLTSLDLSSNNFTGGVPNSIGTLTRLTSLVLSSNNFTEGVPNSIGTLTRLTYLDLSMNNFTGGVPNSIGTLTRLASLDLSWNNFTGHVDFRTFSTLKNLRSLRLSGLSVSGEDAMDANHTFPKLENLEITFGMLNNFPCFLSGMPELWSLYLSESIVSEFPGQCINNGLSFPKIQQFDMDSCNLTKFPSFLSQSNKLRFLDLRRNRIEEIPSWFMGIGIDTLQELYLNDNLLKGGLRLPWKRLDILYLQNNFFEGPLPIPTSRSIRVFRLSKNRFNGSIPLSICQITSLLSLGLSQNNLTGVIPQCLSNLIDLRELDLSRNSLTGPLPLPSNAMSYYSVSKNNFSGEISSLICNATNLQFLDLSSNGITGTLPQCPKNITMRLVYLNLRMNKFHGLIPEIFPKGCVLTFIDFSRNQFGGSLPRSLSNCRILEVLDVGSNKIVDSFPDWLGDLPLKILSLRSNKLHGPVSISKETHVLSTIRVLDLFNNSFEGNLSNSLIDEMFDMRLGDSDSGYMVSSFNTIVIAGVYEQFFSVTIDLKGVETEMVKINVQFATLDLSSNHFCGEIPGNIGLLKSLKGLNFSHNSFTGTIPPSFVNLTNLESLDLSSNYLVGGIPRELAQLTSLGALDLSRNNLTGPIPLGGHFNTFPNSSFDGNPGLCGIPLTRACSQGHAESQPPQNRGDNGEDEPERWLEWKFMAMGFGSGLGIGISLGYMALEIGRPLWLSRIIIRLESGRKKGSKRKSPRRNGRR